MDEGTMPGDWPGWKFGEGRRGRRRIPRPDDLERFGRHFGPPRDVMFGPAFGGGRGRRRRGDVRAAILLLLAEEPRNGYQLMQEIEERSGGRWRPSPGSVYPSLAQLEDEGLIRSTERDGAKLFELTDGGREHLAERGEHAPPWEEDGDDHPAKNLRGQIGAIAQATMLIAKGGEQEHIAKAADVLKRARRELYRILAEDDEE
jgi:DNA-binding PadR family transcriptional regulator